jgi:SAM-dependent methyltransferase
MSDTPHPGDDRPSDRPGPASSRSAHEFDAMYADTPPWDIGRPQPVFLRLAEAGAIRGRVLDAGCGTGEHVLMAAAGGLEATGIDAAPTAIAAAERKASERQLTARFLVWDALALPELGEQFDTVIDSGLFHVFDDERRGRYVEALGAVVRPGGTFFLCCFSERQPGEWGPRRIRQEEIRAAFGTGWKVESIEAAHFDVNLDPPIAQAWLATITRA